MASFRVLLGLGLGTCALVQGVAAAPLNLTVFRITPRNYTGLSNLDTGDAAGDAFFGLYEKSAPLACRDAGSQNNLLCSNDPLLQIPGFNVYIKVVMEVDDRFGDYSECNPVKEAPHPFNCTHHHFSGPSGGCWDKDPKHPEWKTEFADVCDPKKCTCDIIERHAVGREFPRFGIPKVSPGTPPACASNFYPLNHFKNKNASTLKHTIEDTSLAACCSACTAANNAGDECGSYTFTPELFKKNGSCALHGATSFTDLGPALLSSSGFSTGSGPSAIIQKAIGKLSDNMNGTWYSTQEVGRCKGPDDVLGKDCWWREVEQVAQVNATCVNDKMISAVVAQRKGACFDGCARPKDQDSDCWIGCFFETLVGNTSATPAVPATPRALILDAFERAFTPGQGGCPNVPECPSPCLPPCWGVPRGQPCLQS